MIITNLISASGMLKKQKIEINNKNEKAKLKKKLQELKQKKEEILVCSKKFFFLILMKFLLKTLIWLQVS